LAALRAVSERAAQTLKYYEAGNWASLLDIALDHLTLGRAALYAAILGNLDLRTSTLEIDHAISGLLRASQQQFLPPVLLTRAWQRSLTGALTGPESAQSDLDEAWEIAERGPMPLFLADIHLHRARLFGSAKSEGGSGKLEGVPLRSDFPLPSSEFRYPWDKHPDGTARGPKDDLAEARRLIEKHGYWRRKEELEDAERAILNQGGMPSANLLHPGQ
jgi:hypothetical protein